MFGNNKLTKKINNLPQTLFVREIFSTIQGEGPFSGRPATFVRLGGCNLRCTFCDTDFDLDKSRVMSVPQIINACLEFKNKLVVLTGGEPLLQDVALLIVSLRLYEIAVQIETAGTTWPDSLTEDVMYGSLIDELRTTIVVSPKTGTIVPLAAEHADAFKYLVRHTDNVNAQGIPISRTQSEEGAYKELASPPSYTTALVYLQPVEEYTFDEKGNPVQAKEETAKNVARAVELCMKHNFILSLQLHKVIGLP